MNESAELLRAPRNRTMNVTMIAGTVSTSLFVLGTVPMLAKAVRTRSLGSYSLSYLLLSNAANLVHWVYVAALPIGPVWLLHAVYTLSAALLLLGYLRYETRLGREHRRATQRRGAHDGVTRTERSSGSWRCRRPACSSVSRSP